MNLKVLQLVGLALATIAILVLLWKVDSLTKEKSELTKNLANVTKALDSATKSKVNQVKALEEVERKHSDRLSKARDKAIELENNDEKADCNMPSFMRDAFSGVRD